MATTEILFSKKARFRSHGLGLDVTRATPSTLSLLDAPTDILSPARNQGHHPPEESKAGACIYIYIYVASLRPSPLLERPQL